MTPGHYMIRVDRRWTIAELDGDGFWFPYGADRSLDPDAITEIGDRFFPRRTWWQLHGEIAAWMVVCALLIIAGIASACVVSGGAQ